MLNRRGRRNKEPQNKVASFGITKESTFSHGVSAKDTEIPSKAIRFIVLFFLIAAITHNNTLYQVDLEFRVYKKYAPSLEGAYFIQCFFTALVSTSVTLGSAY
jgi:hypothetical protein